MNFIMVCFPPKPGAQPWEDPGLAWTTQEQDSDLQQCKPIHENLSGISGSILRNRKSKKSYNGVYVEFERHMKVTFQKGL